MESINDLSCPDRFGCNGARMKFKASGLRGYTLQATDGLIGTVRDVLFDDRSWKIRWLVIDTGSFLPGRKVLIHPEAVGQAVHDQEQLLVSLTKAQIAASPDLATDQPVSMQMEEHLHDYYGWDPYWGSMFFGSNAIASAISPPPLFAAGITKEAPIDDGSRNEGDPHLRSVESVIGYNIEATDGAIGHLADFQVDDRGWEIRYLVIDTRKWWSGGGHVVISPFAVQGFDWPAHTVSLNLRKAQLQASPPWDPALPLDDAYESRLHEHYGWATEQPPEGDPEAMAARATARTE
jgi:hypothetical protein